MTRSIAMVLALLVAGTSAAAAQPLEGTLKRIKDTGT